MHPLNLHHGNCNRQQNDDDDNMVCIVASKAQHQGNPADPL